MPQQRLHLPLSLVTLAALAACGGSDDPAPGAVLSSQAGVSLSAAQVDGATAASGLQALAGAAACGVQAQKVVYSTRGPRNEVVQASAAVLVPTGTGAACSGERPVLLYAHGTSTDKAKNMADIAADGEAQLVAAMYAAQGFVVVAPNYLGYDVSTLPYHNYLHAESQAQDMVDGLRAAKALLAGSTGARPSAKLLVSGYSQGGHVAMATHKVIERDLSSEFTVTASVPMSGPYNLVGFGDLVTAGTINAGATIFIPMLLTSYQRAYANVYASPAEAYQPAYAATAEALLPSTRSVSAIIAAGQLPADPTFTALWGAGGLLNDSFRASYASGNYRKALEANTLLSWTPRRPMALCGGAQDPTVFWAVNAPVARQAFATAGATVPAWNLEDRSSLPAGTAGDQVYGGFQAQKAAAGANATAQYHGGLVPPFCTALARGYFQQVLASGL
jgi:hypothetical protein